MLQFIFVSILVLLMLFILLLFVMKAGYQLQYLRIKAGQKPGSIWDFLKFRLSDEKQRKLRLQAFLLFPMLYPLALDEQKEELNHIKLSVKRIHITIYFLLIVLIILGIYSEKVFPA